MHTSNLIPLQAGHSATRRGQNAGGAARKHKGRRANLWCFHSSKRNELLTVVGDVLFASILILEMDPRVETYWVEGEDQRSDDGSPLPLHNLWVYFTDGAKALWHCTRSGKVPREDIAPPDVKLVPRSAKIVKAERVLLNNCLLLCAAMTAARHYDIAIERRAILKALRAESPLPLGQLVTLAGLDPALLYAALGHLVACGAIAVELDRKPLSFHTPVVLGGRQ
jgi:hypothetical protein